MIEGTTNFRCMICDKTYEKTNDMSIQDHMSSKEHGRHSIKLFKKIQKNPMPVTLTVDQMINYKLSDDQLQNIKNKFNLD